MTDALRRNVFLENRHWLQVAVALTAYWVVAAMGYQVSLKLASSAETAGIILALLLKWVGLGLRHFLPIFIPLLLVKSLRHLDK